MAEEGIDIKGSPMSLGNVCILGKRIHVHIFSSYLLIISSQWQPSVLCGASI